jgi:hypothetical protein
VEAHITGLVHAHFAVGTVGLIVEVGWWKATNCVVIHVGRFEIHVVVWLIVIHPFIAGEEKFLSFCAIEEEVFLCPFHECQLTSLIAAF